MIDIRQKLEEKKKEYQKIFDSVRTNQEKIQELNNQNNSMLEKGFELQGQVKLLEEMVKENDPKNPKKSESEAK